MNFRHVRRTRYARNKSAIDGFIIVPTLRMQRSDNGQTLQKSMQKQQSNNDEAIRTFFPISEMCADSAHIVPTLSFARYNAEGCKYSNLEYLSANRSAV